MDRQVLAGLTLMTLLLPDLVLAQSTDSCFYDPQRKSGCILGIYDDSLLTKCSGTSLAGQDKALYIGLRPDFPRPDSISAVEFSIAGLDAADVVRVEVLVPAPYQLALGWPSAPADTSASSTGIGGLFIGWGDEMGFPGPPYCATGMGALAKIWIRGYGDTKRLVVKRKYPPTHPEVTTPVFFQCNTPFFTTTRVTGGEYTLNPRGAAPECKEVPVAPTTWSEVKGLYR